MRKIFFFDKFQYKYEKKSLLMKKTLKERNPLNYFWKLLSKILFHPKTYINIINYFSN